MTDKAYIVANEQQEMAVLRVMEQQGYTWNDGDIPTHCIPSHYAQLTFPYVLTNHNFIGWLSIDDARLLNFTVLFDGRKEEQMSEKYVVSQGFMNELEEWKADIRHEWFDKKADGKWLNSADISDLESITEDWWLDTEISYKESNNRLIAIIRWVNGEDVFEVEKPKRWVVRSKETDSKGSHLYVFVSKDDALCYSCLGLVNATHFATKEEAQSWANSHQEVVEVGE